MTDLSISHGSLLGGADPKLRKRRWAVIRLKTYGIAAIAASGLALFALLGSVVTQTAASVRESYLTIPVYIDPGKIDPAGSRDAKKILRADFAGLTKTTLKQQFPAIKGRKEKRQLYDIVSSGAPFELAEMVSNDLSLVGQTINYRFLASDVSDLYLKGSYGRLDAQMTQGALSLTKAGKSVLISSTESDFAGALQQVKSHLLIEAARKRRQSALQNNGVTVFKERAEAAQTADARQHNLKLVKSRAAKRDRLLAEAAGLEARAKGDLGAEDLSRENLSLLINVGGGWIKLTRLAATSAEGKVLTAIPDNVRLVRDWQLYATELPEASRKVSDGQIVAIETLKAAGAVDRVFNWRFFTSGDSREPELAGIKGAAIGSFWTMLVTFSLAFPIGVSAAIYLEEFAPKNKFTSFIEVNINNLAAVPSIVFGLLGLSVFLGVFGVPRSSPLAGGIVLALMTLPTIIIAARAAIKAVPPSIRDAALGVGASKMQTTFHHVLPLAMPGVLTGSILGMAQALGETAPLIMIGMVAFIVDVPAGITDSASVLPVQVYRWSDFPERAFAAKTGAAIAVLLGFLVIMNAIAIILRRRFERRW